MVCLNNNRKEPYEKVGKGYKESEIHLKAKVPKWE